MIKLELTQKQQFLCDEILDVSRFVYNKTNALIKEDIYLHKNFMDLRNKLVTSRTKMNSNEYKNHEIEIETLRITIKNTLNENEKLSLIKTRNLLLSKRRLDVKNIPYSINTEIKEFELNVSKEIRANSVKKACDAYKTSLSNLKVGNIKFFNIGFLKKNNPRQCAELSKSDPVTNET